MLGVLDVARERVAIVGEALEELYEQLRDLHVVRSRLVVEVVELTTLGDEVQARHSTREYPRSAREHAADLEPETARPRSSLDVAARLRDDMLHDRQPEAGAARRARAVAAIEALEEPRQLVFGNATPVVRDREQH